MRRDDRFRTRCLLSLEPGQGYDGTVAMEAWAAEDSDLALERFRSAFAPVTLSMVTPGGLS